MEDVRAQEYGSSEGRHGQEHQRDHHPAQSRMRDAAKHVVHFFTGVVARRCAGRLCSWELGLVHRMLHKV